MKNRVGKSNSLKDIDSKMLRPEDGILLVNKPRQGWGNAFRAMAQNGDDELLDKNLLSQSCWDDHEWEW
jgi:hypothetical protein